MRAVWQACHAQAGQADLGQLFSHIHVHLLWALRTSMPSSMEIRTFTGSFLRSLTTSDSAEPCDAAAWIQI